jgi:tRNA(His) 5'-end guanylyltransferase
VYLRERSEELGVVPKHSTVGMNAGRVSKPEPQFCAYLTSKYILILAQSRVRESTMIVATDIARA